ncbi:MAG: hypothetical protein U0263_22530 [Polyangiaceae bacterium]
MPSVHLRIEPDLVGPVSVGTVRVIRALADGLGLELQEAAAHVERAAFEGETLVLPARSEAEARACVERLTKLEGPARIDAHWTP